jgi:hypothetical protein
VKVELRLRGATSMWAADDVHVTLEGPSSKVDPLLAALRARAKGLDLEEYP